MTPSEKPNSPRADARRRQILEGAIRAFAARGFYRTRVSDIAKAAGVADGTIYLYFKGKDDLLANVLRQALDSFWERGEAYVLEADSSAEQLGRFVELHLRYMGEDRDLATVFQVDLRHSPHFLGDVSRKIFRDYLERVAEIVAQGQASGELRRDLSPLQAAQMVFGVLDQLVTSWVLTHRNYRLESLSDQARGFVLRALVV
jgi:TetR/AcrR family transcriptional regulator, fatty acid metabolism regulator protein